MSDRSTFYDNSRAKVPFRIVAAYERGRLVGEADWPAWTPTVLTR
jgi:predicted ABC-type ATPase